jgi:hypothetical protein
MKIATLMLALALTGCGTIWTVGFFGATLSVQFPQQAQLTVYATAATAPATQLGGTK